MFPTWPAKSEMAKRPKKKDVEHSPQAPQGGAMFAKLVSVLRQERFVTVARLIKPKDKGSIFFV